MIDCFYKSLLLFHQIYDEVELSFMSYNGLQMEE